MNKNIEEIRRSLLKYNESFVDMLKKYNDSVRNDERLFMDMVDIYVEHVKREIGHMEVKDNIYEVARCFWIKREDWGELRKGLDRVVMKLG